MRMNRPNCLHTDAARIRYARRPECRSQRVVSRPAIRLLLTALWFITGCSARPDWKQTVGNDVSAVDRVVAAVDHPLPDIHTAAWSAAPNLARDRKNLDLISYRDISLDEVLRTAMSSSDFIRDLGGTVLRNPEAMQSRFHGPLQVTDPRFSSEAALSAFDAQFKASAFFSNNDKTFNNPFFAGGTNTFKQDLHEYSVELSKRTATGSQLSLRSLSQHDANNAPGNTFSSAWDTYIEGEMRQPLLQGGGLQFNRIAGPGSTPGIYNGVLIAKVNSDISQTDFEAAIRDYVSNVTNAYWDLYFCYRDLDARGRAMKRSLEVWNRIKAKQDSDMEAGASEALAREQYYRFKAEVDEALTGRIAQGTQNRNGSTGGTVRGSSGVQVAERRLRLLTGMPITDGTLLRPADQPFQADVVFDWESILQEALTNRPEVRRQLLQVRKREMELLAARNFLNPQLDAVGRYRFRGFGNDLLRTQETARNTSAVGNLAGGGLQEWYLGFEYTVPIGYRQAHLAVNNAELMLSRERVIYREQQRQIVHDLSNAVADASRAFESCQDSLNRYMAARELLQSYDAKDQNDLDIDVDRLLDAQRRVADAEIRYFQSRIEYEIALKNVHLEKNSLMAHSGLQIHDSTTPPADDLLTDGLPDEKSRKKIRSQVNSAETATHETGPLETGLPEDSSKSELPTVQL